MTNPLQRMPSTGEVLEARNCSSSTLYNDIAARPVKLGPMRNGWPDSDLMAEQQARIAEVDARAAGSPRVADADAMRRGGGILMPAPLLHVRDIPIDQVSVVGPRRRALNDEAVAALVASIERSGLLTPIAVRIREDAQSPGAEPADPAYVLVAGLHRLEACRKLGWRHIPAIVCECSRLEAELRAPVTS